MQHRLKWEGKNDGAISIGKRATVHILTLQVFSFSSATCECGDIIVSGITTGLLSCQDC